MPYRMVVLVKQVPDTKNVTGKAMKADGTVNRAALPAIFNPEDFNALEMALALRDRHGGHVTVVTMGPPRAAEVLRQALMRGADEVALLTDVRFAVADTLATAYTLVQGVLKTGDYDLVICGRQAIDGDTAQTGPQVAGKLGIPQITYAEEVESLDDGKIRIRRLIEGGYEVVEVPLPALITVVSTANDPRPPAAKRMMRFKKARAATELKWELSEEDVPAAATKLEQAGLLIPEWKVEDVGADAAQCGLAGSPTRVKKIQGVVLASSGHTRIEPTEDGLREFFHKLHEDHTLD